MIITSATYQKLLNEETNQQENVSIKAVINGKTLIVPLDEANTDYQAIQEWAAIEGNNIIDPGA
jgi:hypothetical protein